MLKKPFISIITSLILTIPLVSAAQTTTPQVSDLQTQVRQLEERIKTLLEYVASLQTQLKTTKKEIAEVKAELKLTRSLRIGTTGEDVKKLQELLKQFPDIYPEGLVTGFFGPLTEAAVKKLQEKQGIEIVGVVGPKTLIKINELLSEGAGASGVIPPGLLTAPGIQKEIEITATTTAPVATTTLPIVAPPSASATTTTATTTPAAIATTTPSGTVTATPAVPAIPAISASGSSISAVPATSAQPVVQTGTTTTASDTTPPTAPTNLTATSTSSTQINLSWTVSTDNVGVAGYRIYRGGAQIATVTASTSYSDTGLVPATTYSYTISSYDAAGSVSTQSSSVSAATQAPPDATPPVISNIQAINITQTSTTITWTTDEASDSIVEYSLTTSYGSTLNIATTTTSHQIALSNLTSGATYHYRVKSADSSGNSAQSDDQTFTTSSPPPASGNLLRRLDGPSNYSYFGSRTAVGDVNGDNKNDIIIGAHQTGASRQGGIYVFSGANYQQLYHFQGNTANERLGYGVASGDVNGDGKKDIITGNTNGNLYVYSGTDGSMIWNFSIGGRVVGLAASDLNGDGKDDVVVGDETFNNFSGRIRVYSGPEVELFNINSPVAQAQIGSTLALADVNGDGKKDIVFPVFDYTSSTGRTCSNAMASFSSIHIHSGVDGSLIRTINNPKSGERFGYPVASAGDINSDGKEDIIIGAPVAEWAGCESGSAYIFSGATGAQLHRFDGGTHYDMFGISVAGAGDINNDGKSDVMVGALFADPNGLDRAGSVYVYSGADYSLLNRFNGEAIADEFGVQITAGSDINGDGVSDAIISAKLYTVGSVYIYSLASSPGVLKNLKNQLAFVADAVAQLMKRIKELITR